MKFQWMRMVGATAVVVAVVAGSVAAQENPPQGRGGFFGGPGGGFFGGGNEMSLISDPKVQKELDILDDQVAKLKEINEKQQTGMRDLFSGMRDLNDEQRRAKWEEIQGKLRERGEETRKQMSAILLPHQSKRLSELARQQRMRSTPGGGGGLSADQLATELKLSDEAKEKLKAKAEEVQAKLREKLAKIRKEAEDDLLGVLTPEQRDQWKALVGEPFEFSPPQFGGTRRPGGDDGNRRPGGGDAQPRRTN